MSNPNIFHNEQSPPLTPSSKSSQLDNEHTTFTRRSARKKLRPFRTISSFKYNEFEVLETPVSPTRKTKRLRKHFRSLTTSDCQKQPCIRATIPPQLQKEIQKELQKYLGDCNGYSFCVQFNKENGIEQMQLAAADQEERFSWISQGKQPPQRTSIVTLPQQSAKTAEYQSVIHIPKETLIELMHQNAENGVMDSSCDIFSSEEYSESPAQNLQLKLQHASSKLLDDSYDDELRLNHHPCLIHDEDQEYHFM